METGLLPGEHRACRSLDQHADQWPVMGSLDLESTANGRLHIATTITPNEDVASPWVRPWPRPWAPPGHQRFGHSVRPSMRRWVQRVARLSAVPHLSTTCDPGQRSAPTHTGGGQEFSAVVNNSASPLAHSASSPARQLPPMSRPASRAFASGPLRRRMEDSDPPAPGKVPSRRECGAGGGGPRSNGSLR